MGFKFFFERNTSKTQVIKKNCTINWQKMANFHDSFIIYTWVFVLSWTLCKAGEQWISGFVWHQNIMVTQYQPRAVSFVLTWHNLTTWMSHCISIRTRRGIYGQILPFAWRSSPSMETRWARTAPASSGLLRENENWGPALLQAGLLFPYPE